ncbi:MAG: peroxiredoxin [Deltaproteobacteria bacterium]|nr:peroxiredoxin [Deltaproteobacteria bacterium]
MSLKINELAPDFTAQTTEGELKFHEWIGDGYAVLFSHPKDFTPVCTTELGAVARLQGEFAQRGAKVIGLSVDPVERHLRWKADIAAVTGAEVRYPLIADTELVVAKLYGMLPAALEGTAEGRTAADNATVRTVFIIGPDKRIKLSLTYPMTTGRNFDELLRALDSIRLSASAPLATPAGWRPGEDVIVSTAVSTEAARERFGEVREELPYLRWTAQPAAPRP